MEAVIDKKKKIELILPDKIKIVPHDFSTLKIIPFKEGYPDDAIEKIINTFSKYTSNFFDRIEFIKSDRAIVYHKNQPISYEIHFSKDRITFLYAIPSIYKNVFINKLKFIFPSCSIQEIDDPIDNFKRSYRQRYEYKNHWFSSIGANNKTNISDSFMAIHKNITNDNEQILLQYLAKPIINDAQWKTKWEHLYKKYSATGTLPTTLRIGGIIEKILDFVLNQMDAAYNAILTNVFCGSEYESNTGNSKITTNITDETKHKILGDGFKTKINLFVKSSDMLMVNNTVRDVNTIFKDIDGQDNGLVPKGKTKIVKVPYREIKRSCDISNTKEVKQMLKLPSKEILKNDDWSKYMDIVNTVDIDIPKELFNPNYLQLGEIKKGSVYTPITFGNHPDSLSKPLVYIAPMGGGKGTFAQNYTISAVEKGHSVFLFDSIDGNNISMVRDRLSKTFPEEKIIVLDFENRDYILPLLWNEVSESYLKDMKNIKDRSMQYQLTTEFSNLIGSELVKFIDTLKADGSKDSKLTDAMVNVLTQLTQLVFMNNGTFSQVKECISDVGLRHKLLDQLKLPRSLPFVKNVLRIDNEIEGTLKGVETRLNRLMENPTIQKYFSVQSDKKIDFGFWADNGYCVLINVPQTKFGNAINPIITFLVQKLWLTMLCRKDIKEEKRNQCHLILDEPNTYPAVMDLLCENIVAGRKWKLRFVFMIHNFGIFRNMQENLKSSGASFMIVPPTSPMNHSVIANFFDPFGIAELNEAQRLIAKYNGKLRFAMCSIHYQNANYPCIVKLPIPPKDRYPLIDRSYLNAKYSMEYGVSEKDYYANFFDDEDFDDVDSDVDFSVE